MKKMFLMLIFLFSVLAQGCSNVTTNQESVSVGESNSTVQSDKQEKTTLSSTEISEENSSKKMIITVNGNTFTATLESNSAVDELVKMMKSAPIVISMSDYSGFEKVGSLGTKLSTSNEQITTQSGDIVLYNENQIVIFYGSNLWSYTRLGKVDNLNDWKKALGSGDVTVTFGLE